MTLLTAFFPFALLAAFFPFALLAAFFPFALLAAFSLAGFTFAPLAGFTFAPLAGFAFAPLAFATLAGLALATLADFTFEPPDLLGDLGGQVIQPSRPQMLDGGTQVAQFSGCLTLTWFATFPPLAVAPLTFPPLTFPPLAFAPLAVAPLAFPPRSVKSLEQLHGFPLDRLSFFQPSGFAQFDVPAFELLEALAHFAGQFALLASSATVPTTQGSQFFLQLPEFTDPFCGGIQLAGLAQFLNLPLKLFQPLPQLSRLPLALAAFTLFTFPCFRTALAAFRFAAFSLAFLRRTDAHGCRDQQKHTEILPGFTVPTHTLLLVCLVKDGLATPVPSMELS